MRYEPSSKPKPDQQNPKTNKTTSSLVSEERSLVLRLILITFAGEEIQLSIELQEFDRLNEFENASPENLPYIGEYSTFGRELDFVHKDTRKILADPIWDTLRENKPL